MILKVFRNTYLRVTEFLRKLQFMNLILTDQYKAEHRLAAAPTRIVSLVPSQTELLCDLGLESHIVGVTKFCVRPFSLRAEKTIVGGTKAVKMDVIRALRPDIVMANREENTLEIVEALKAFTRVWVTDVRGIGDNLRMIEDFGQLFNVRTQALKIADKIKWNVARFEAFMQARPSRKTAYFIWKDPYMVAGGDTYIDAMLELNKFDNIYRDKGRYPEIKLGRIRLEGDPEVVILSSEPFPFKDQDAFEIGRYTHHGKTVFADGEMFSWHGSRLLKAIPYFEQLQLRLDRV